MILLDLNVLLDVIQQRDPYYRASAAEAADCSAIVTRNVKDFPGSPVAVLTPEEFLMGSKDEPI